MSSTAFHLAPVPCPTLRAAHARSRAALAGFDIAFARRAAALRGVLTVAVGGSLGRLEATADSDIDCIVVLDTGVDAVRAAALMAEVQAVFAEAPFRTAKIDGIYRSPVARDALLDGGARGSLSEDPAVFGKRIQLLLDARPVFDAPAFARLQGDIVDWYAADFIAARPARGWTFLQNDLLRYLHSYAGWQQFKFARGVDDSWQLRQAKLRSTRLLTFAGLLFLLGESNARVDKCAWLRQELDATPLARLQRVMEGHEPGAYAALLGDYEQAFALLTEPRVRARLVTSGPDEDTRLAAPLDAAFEQLRAVTARLSAALTGFALARRQAWGERFFERWLF